jgi:hypothetical protein
MDQGKLVSQGTVDEIKKRFGVGYNLKITYNDQINVAELKERVCTMVPGSYISMRQDSKG